MSKPDKEPTRRAWRIGRFADSLNAGVMMESSGRRRVADGSDMGHASFHERCRDRLAETGFDGPRHRLRGVQSVTAGAPKQLSHFKASSLETDDRVGAPGRKKNT